MSRLPDTPIVVITGASGGVGRATVREFTRYLNGKVKLGLIARGTEGLEAARREVEALGGMALALPLDVADADMIEDAVKTIEQDLGPIDIWVNNAMTTVFGPFMRSNPDEFRRVTEVTYLGYVYATQAVLRRMLPRNSGTIVQVGSSIAYRGIPLQTAYSGAKHAIQGFTEALREELLHDHSSVHITMVQLPGLNTPQFTWCKTTVREKKWQPVPPIFQPEIAAKAIVWSSHHKRREVYVGGSTLKAIWANNCIPGFVDKYLGKTGYNSQFYDGPQEDRPDNLWDPVKGDFGAHGPFDDRSLNRSYQLWVTMHRTLLGVAALGVGIAGAVFAGITKKHARDC
ncbi:MAG: SDR family NAD(P)-dependent oxidoreductase [Chitinivibrionales bacterium]|nr:SDR family NAD(P)-dependent oxidoreductase [Chitinivibrionales bacterium]